MSTFLNAISAYQLHSRAITKIAALPGNEKAVRIARAVERIMRWNGKRYRAARHRDTPTP